MKLVVDASVAVKWFVEKEGSDSAHGLLESRLGQMGLLELVAPEFTAGVMYCEKSPAPSS